MPLKPGDVPTGASVPLGLLPEPGDPNFAARLAEVPEFASAHVGKLRKKENPCAAKSGDPVFQIAPHQRFVRSFMSASTPYNGLLLFHGLGSGKTCAAMQVAEETFATSALMGSPRRTYVVAAPNLQVQFREKLYDADVLTRRNGVWTMPGCVAPELLREALPDPRSAEPKETIVKRLEQAVRRRYAFAGPDQLANAVAKILSKYTGIQSSIKRDKLQRKAMTEAFGNRLYIIDEAHDLRIGGAESTSAKRAWDALKKIAELAEGTKLLLLTATPVFDSAMDILSLLNLLLLNDGRIPLKASAYFDTKGNLKDLGAAGRLAADTTGYVSFVSSQDTDAFPFLLNPSQFGYKQPEIAPPQFNLKNNQIPERRFLVDIANVSLSAYQEGVLEHLMDKLRSRGKGLGYTEIARAVMALNIVYPGFNPKETTKYGSEHYISSQGLKRTVRNLSGTGTKSRLSGPYVYDPAVEKTYGDIFAPTQIGEYSAKIARMLEEAKGEGIILIYSQYLESGAVPLALALERAGYVRRDGPSLWDANGPAPPQERGGYVLITGDKTLSPNNKASVAMATTRDNARGEKVKIVVISQTGSQGVDLRAIRQVHLLDPWYNLGRVAQIVGRARRRCSHVDLPPDQRNVSLYFYGTRLRNREEAADVYVYSLASDKAEEGGRITRALKERSVDCWVSDENKIEEGRIVSQVASNGTLTKVSTAPEAYTIACDYQSSCRYQCSGDKPGPMVMPMYSDRLIEIAGPPLLAALRGLFAKRVYYSRDDLHQKLGKDGEYTNLQIDAALTALVTQPEQWVINPQNIPGHVQNIGQYYLFAPIGLEEARLSLQDRLTGGLTMPQAVEVEAPDVKLGQTKVFSDASDGAKLAKIIWRRANRENKYEPIPPGVHDIPWAQGAVNVFTDTRNVKRGSEAIQLPMDVAGSRPDDAIVRENLIRMIVIREVEILSAESKLALLRAGASRKIQQAIGDAGEEAILSTLLGLGGPFHHPPPFAWDNVFVFGDYTNGTLEYYRGTPGQEPSVRQASPAEIREFMANRASMPPLAVIHGIVGPHKKQYLAFRVVDTRAMSSQKGWRCDQAPKRNVLKALDGLAPNVFDEENTKGIGSSRELCIDLEVILRSRQEQKSDDKQWIINYEQMLLSKASN